ncbi:hypothetical protein OIE66_40045 [Nonomuraea sp. NBC_01738]|uniref:hypothetical protein n=1 Tax=Nonomuraea sp. NBC_01738 TaxID=2976003 RepID=UPI002E12242B|nr:hypothetical protein OIE66_40045 [Nonomuraea sp. NBC_01738]
MSSDEPRTGCVQVEAGDCGIAHPAGEMGGVGTLRDHDLGSFEDIVEAGLRSMPSAPGAGAYRVRYQAKCLDPQGWPPPMAQPEIVTAMTDAVQYFLGPARRTAGE